MTKREICNRIYRKCLNCRFWSCGVWVNGEPDDDFGVCSAHGYNAKDGEEEACRSFDYAEWAITKERRAIEEGADNGK